MIPRSKQTFAADSVADLIGNTPIVHLPSFGERLYGKLESANPYSVKDRIAREIIDIAEREGSLTPGGTVVEATSGNTGIGLASVCAARGYDCILTMPESMSVERRQMLRAFGAELILTDPDGGMGEARKQADDIVDTKPNAIRARQFANAANPRAHRRTTGPEIWEVTDGAIDALVAGVGTGGTITGVSEYIKEEREESSFTAVGVEPRESPTISEQSSERHEIQGMGPGFLPDVFRPELIDEVIQVSAEEAKATSRELARNEGFLVGISSGGALAAARQYCEENPDDLTIVVLPDTGERYLSTDLFDTEK